MRIAVSALLALAAAGLALADGPEDNDPTKVRRIPAAGIELSGGERTELGDRIRSVKESMKGLESDLLPDIEVLVRAVEDNLVYEEFQKKQEINTARQLLDLAEQRIAELRAGNPSWVRQTGLVVRGFRSRLDGSVQPYGLVVPESYNFDGGNEHRLDFWFHGRGENMNEIGFIQQRLTQEGQFAPKDTIVLHPYARYSNGNKFAGEIDCLEALEHVRAHYRVDENRVLVRGFSMGGAACWNLAVHYADRWAAASPGAGFSETPEFLRVFQGEELKPTWYQRKLWHLYDCTDYAINLFNLPTVAYSGEIDRQKQAADIMEQAMAAEGLKLTHLIGPDTEHKIHPDSKIEIDRRLDSIAAAGRDPLPARVCFTTWTLRYDRMHWVVLDRLGEHWERARLDADITGPTRIEVKRIENVEAFTFDMPPGRCPLDPFETPIIAIGNQEIEGPPVGSDRSWIAHFRLENGDWKCVEERDVAGLLKKHGLQGPIDDAFMDSFLFVEPSGEPFHASADEFVRRELDHARTHWRQQFRGQARVKTDSEVTENDMAAHNLVLWGDPSSNQVIAAVMQRLPISWDDQWITAGDRRFDARHHALILIYPNPLNPERYIVINSGFTYREYDYLNNARQVPKLPDWAIVDTRTPMTSQGPGKIVAADFFGERWELKTSGPAASKKPE